MKRTKKLLIALLSATCLTAGAFGLVACENDTSKGMTAVYNQYVSDTQAAGGTALSYEEWLKSVLSVGGKGEQGAPGTPGKDGTNGTNGKSAYQIYCDSVYANDGVPLSETEWLASLKGSNGTNGTNGKSAYELAVAAGYTGTEEQWLASLKGDKGDTPVVHTHSYNNQYVVIIPSTGDTEGIGYKTCTATDCDHIELVVVPTYSYKVTVYYSDLSFGIGESNPTVAAGAKVSLKKGSETVAEATTDEKGEVIFNGVEKGEYNIVVKKDGYVSVAEVYPELAGASDMDVDMSGVTSKDASDYGAVLATLPADGEDGSDNKPYHLTDTLGSEMFYLDAPYYTTGMGSDYGSINVTFAATKSGYYYFGTVDELDIVDSYMAPIGQVALSAGEEFSFIIYNVGENGFSITDSTIMYVMCDKQDAGTQGIPYAVKLTDEVSVTAKPEDTVYFKLIRKSGDATKAKITFEDGVVVYGNDDMPLTSGAVIDFGSNYTWEYRFTASAEDGKIAFTTEAYYTDGEKGKPIALELGTAVNLENNEVWFKLVVAEKATYIIEQNVLSVEFFTDVNGEAVYTSQSPEFAYTFTAGTHYICVNSNGGGTFKVRETNAQDVGVIPTLPDVATANMTTVPGLRYYKYTAQTACNVVIWPEEYVNFTVYTDSTFETPDFPAYNNKPIAVQAGDVIYFMVNSPAGGESFTIKEIAENEEIQYSITVVSYVDTNDTIEGIKVNFMQGSEVKGHATSNENGVATVSLPAGDYTIDFDLTDAQKEDYRVLFNSEYSVTVTMVSTSSNALLQRIPTYTVTVEGLDALTDEQKADVKVGFYVQRWEGTNMTWELVQSYDLTENSASFKLPGASTYKVAVTGLPEGYTAKEAQISNSSSTTTYTLTVSEKGAEGPVDYVKGTIPEGEEGWHVTITESGTYAYELEIGANGTAMIYNPYMGTIKSIIYINYNNEEYTIVENGVVVDCAISSMITSSEDGIFIKGCYGPEDGYPGETIKVVYEVEIVGSGTDSLDIVIQSGD